MEATAGVVGTSPASRLTGQERRFGRGSVVGWVLPASLLIGAMVFFFLGLVEDNSGDMQCALALGITAAPFIVAAAEAPGRLLHPLAVFGFTMLLGIAGQTIYIVKTDPANLPELLSNLQPDILNRGLLVVSVGVIVMLAGYLVSRPALGQPRPGWLLSRGVQMGLGRPDPKRTLWLTLVICGAALFAFAIYAPKVGLHSPADLLSSRKRFVLVQGKVVVYGYLRLIINLAGTGFLLGVYAITRNRMSWRSPLGAVAIVSVLLTAGFATVTSSRTELFAIVATGAFVIIALRHREPRVSMIVGVLVAAVASLTLLGGLRAVDAGQATSLSSQTGTDALLENAIGSKDWMDIGPISVVTERVPEVFPYQYGKTLVSLLWAPIPRTMWASKPPVRIGPVIGPPVFGFSHRITGDPPGILAEFWINGGILAVIAGMFVLGAVIKRVERWYRMVERTDGLSALLYGVMVVAICLQLPIADFTGVLISVIEHVAVLSLFLWIVRAPLPNPLAGGRAAPPETA